MAAERGARLRRPSRGRCRTCPDLLGDRRVLHLLGLKPGAGRLISSERRAWCAAGGGHRASIWRRAFAQSRRARIECHVHGRPSRSSVSRPRIQRPRYRPRRRRVDADHPRLGHPIGGAVSCRSGPPCARGDTRSAGQVSLWPRGPRRITRSRTRELSPPRTATSDDRSPADRMHPDFRGTVRSRGAILMGAVGLVLLIASANIANLLLSGRRRATARWQSALRSAPAARVIRQMLIESPLLGLAGAEWAAVRAVDRRPPAAVLPGGTGAPLDTRVDRSPGCSPIGSRLSASILFGLAPALQAATPTSAARFDGRGSLLRERDGHPVRRILVSRAGRARRRPADRGGAPGEEPRERSRPIRVLRARRRRRPGRAAGRRIHPQNRAPRISRRPSTRANPARRRCGEPHAYAAPQPTVAAGAESMDGYQPRPGEDTGPPSTPSGGVLRDAADPAAADAPSTHATAPAAHPSRWSTIGSRSTITAATLSAGGSPTPSAW